MFAKPIIRHIRDMPIADLLRFLVSRLWISLPFVAATMLWAPMPIAWAQDDKPVEWFAGAYSFSDELGGFTIDAVSGSGTKESPVVLRETLNSSSPVTLVIRAKWPVRTFDPGISYNDGVLYLRIAARNGSGQGWIEFEFELQELLGKASVFGDGLSFDQRSASKDNISSDTFEEFSRDFEPYDKLLFRRGKIDPGQSGEFSFLITDFTPRPKFYLVQDPRIPSS
jgi:hypothetical protein